jgi:hypothetical protein
VRRVGARLASRELVEGGRGRPPILAAGGGLLGWSGRDAPRGAGRCRAALVIAVLAVIAGVAILVGDSTNSI